MLKITHKKIYILILSLALISFIVPFCSVLQAKASTNFSAPVRHINNENLICGHAQEQDQGNIVIKTNHIPASQSSCCVNGSHSEKSIIAEKQSQLLAAFTFILPSSSHNPNKWQIGAFEVLSENPPPISGDISLLTVSKKE